MSGRTQASTVQAAVPEVGITGLPASFRKAYSPSTLPLSQALSSREVQIAYKVRAVEDVTACWSGKLVPVPFASVFHSLNVCAVRVNELAVSEVGSDVEIACEAELPLPPFGSKVN